jgi:hypothetical protein
MSISKVKYISSPAEIPPVKLCAGHVWRRIRETRHSLGLTITVARQRSKTVSELSFLTAVHTAKGIGKHEGISGIYACNSSTYSECAHVAETDIRDGA